MLDWFQRNGFAISMFIGGWCAFAAFDNLIREQYGWAAFNAAIAYANVKLANS